MHWDRICVSKWEKVREVRTRVTEGIEPLRRDKVIRSSLEAEVDLMLADASAAEAVSSVDFTEICIVSELRAAPGAADTVAISRTTNEKCGRCWRHLPEVPEDGALCARCEEVVNG